MYLCHISNHFCIVFFSMTASSTVLKVIIMYVSFNKTSSKQGSMFPETFIACAFFPMFLSFAIFYASSCPIQHVPAESARSAGEIGKALELSHSSTMLTGSQLLVPFRVRLSGRVSFWPRQLVRSSAELTTGEISLAFGHTMEIRLSRRLQSGVPPFTPYNACLLIVIVGVLKALLARNCNINKAFKVIVKAQLMERDAIYI